LIDITTVGGLVTKWVSVIFLIFVPVLASVNVCTEIECFPVSNEDFLQLDQPTVMKEIAYHYPWQCDVLNTHPLGVLSWVQDLILGSPCDEIRTRETLKFLVGVAIREDFEEFAASSTNLEIKFSPDEKYLDNWPTIKNQLLDLENSLSEAENKNSALKKSIKKFNNFKSQGLSGCASLFEGTVKGFVKEGKKAATSKIKSWSKEAKK
jgi:hypothetical protein